MKLKHLILGTLCAFGLNAHAALVLGEASGWHESAYMTFTGLTAGTTYNAYVSSDGGSSWTALDPELVRSYGTYGRVDAVGLAAGTNYRLRVVPVATDGSEVTAEAVVSPVLTVINYKRAGFAHTGAYVATGTKGVGAYNNDGTLKAGAKVIYVTAANAKTVSTTVTGATTNPCVGFQAIIAGYEKGGDQTPIAFRIIGTLTAADMDALGSSAEGLQIKGRRADSELNITVEGIGNDAMLRFGFLVRNTASLEIRNLGIATTLDDDVSLDTDNDHVWIHNLDVFYGPNKGGDQKKGDGAIDVKSDSKHVTVASNHFWDTGKSSMCGMTSESGPNYITYHDNWFDHSDSRHARIRTMSVHMYNNYFDGNAKYCVGSTMGSSVFVENNFFRNCPKPMLISKQGTDIHMGVGSSDETKGTFSGEAGGIIKSYGNAYSGNKTLVTYQTNSTHFDCWEATSRDAQVPPSVTSLVGGNHYDNFDTNASLMYVYTPAAASAVQANVTGFHGAGRINHGDLQYTFNNATDDSDYDITSALRSAIDNYSSSLVAIIGHGASSQGGGQGGGGGEGGDDPDPQPVGGSYEWYVEGGQGSSAFYSVTGNYTSGKGPVNYAGRTMTEALKMESSTVVSFTTTESLDFVFVTDGATGKKIKVDDVDQALPSGGVLSMTLAAGSHTLKKRDTMNLFYINATGGSATSLSTTVTAPQATKILRDGQLLILRDGRTYTVTGNILE